MAGHTPGPWMAEFTGEHAETRDGFWEIAPIGADGAPDWSREIAATADPNEANAHLIAAAPELLALCKKAEELIYGEFPRGWKIHDELAAAIAKAEGR